ncbi:glycosyltransferase family 1 protein [Acinetobacter variabilis]|uniref:glycosyltransferase family 1 protein n=1 Tax=Acinetobacter variabilis TaxID=70346 RepID=UPI0028A2167D|nr:glycosyltransferase family 1 protein [Acinetobacter variabilis]
MTSKRVVHVLGAMNAGGTEAWLMALLRNTDRTLIQHDFIVHSYEKGFYDDEIKLLGGNIYPISFSKNPIKYFFNLYNLFKKLNPDVVHSHVHVFSGLVLLVAFIAGVTNRISHSHTDLSVQQQGYNLIRRVYWKIMQKLILVFATTKIAVSQKAALNLYGENYKGQKSCLIMPCGIDLKKYDKKNKDINMRKEFGLPDDAFVLGHVGRFEESKNHDFLIDLLYEIRKVNPNVYLVLVGDGTLKEKIEKKVKNLDLEPYVIFTGLRKDVPIIMLSVFDVFLFPSFYEGLGLVAIEAQLSGLRSICSKFIPQEVDIGNCIFINLESEIWINKIIEKEKKEKYLHIFNFNINSNIDILGEVYGVE